MTLHQHALRKTVSSGILTYILFEPIQLNHTSTARIDLELISSRRSAPLRAQEFRLVESECLPSSGLPAQPRLGEPTLSRLCREVEVDIVKRLPAPKLALSTQERTLQKAWEDGASSGIATTVRTLSVVVRELIK